MKPGVIHSNSFVDDAAQVILESAQEAIEARGSFRIALSGGNTPRPVFSRLADIGFDLPWDKVIFTFGDERCVPPDDEQSNFRMARLALLDRVASQSRVLRIRGELPPHEAAAEYEQKLQDIASESGEPRYIHDLLLLGLGDDGHTASLFPGTEALEETRRNVVANFVPKFSTHRITFTFPLINAARHVCFLVNDTKKDTIISEILAGGPTAYPAARVQPEHGRLTWLLGS
jgi:6-phosphogluconolactonase